MNTRNSADPWLVTRNYQRENTIIPVGSLAVGDGSLCVIAGPCSVESQEQIQSAASIINRHGATMLRGGAFKPRTSPYTFQGLGKQGLVFMKQAAEEFSLPVVTEVLEIRDVELVASYADVLQIGARNMQNYPLLRECAKAGKPILLKRAMSARIDEFLLSAEYILDAGNPYVILCERGIRTFSDHAKNTLDLSIVPALKKNSHLPVFVDPSHSTGIREFVPSMALAAVASGADGLLIEVHPNPEASITDKQQAIGETDFANIMKKAVAIHECLNK
jgi:3-deoxy-7-phosphoheptulonate synthase